MTGIEYVKRIIVFSPDVDIQDSLEEASKNYFGSTFDDYTKKSGHRVEVQKFLSIGDSYTSDSYAPESKIGKGGEVLVLFDLGIKKSSNRIQSELLRGLFEAEQTNCLRIKVPYGIYEKGRVIPLTWGNTFMTGVKKSLSDTKLEIIARLDAEDLFELKPRSH